jgi:hypothetical protein
MSLFELNYGVVSLILVKRSETTECPEKRSVLVGRAAKRSFKRALQPPSWWGDGDIGRQSNKDICAKITY